MRALCWHGINDVRVDTVPDPKIQEPTDVIIKITRPRFADRIFIFTMVL
jgi:threonine dehydrogenase-like Zn-dependent dehydrogenase